MEQVRVALAWLAKYHFWLLSVVAVIFSSLVWWMAAKDLAERKEENINKINAAFSEQQNLYNRPLHANDEVNRKQEQQNEAIAAETERIWQELYDRQRKDVLTWPRQLPSSFRRVVESLQFGDELNKNNREQYTTYIRRKFEDLPKLIDANEVDEETSSLGGGFGGGMSGFGGEDFGEGGMGMGRGMGGMGMGGMGMGGPGEMELDEDGNPIEVEYTVYWAPEDQQRVAAELDWPTTQSHWRIWVTQEDLWVYEAMLRAIANTNEAKGADRLANAAVAGISALQVGRDAAQQSRTPNRILKFQVAGGDGMGGEGMMGMGMGGEDFGMDRGMGGGEDPYGEGDMMGMGGMGMEGGDGRMGPGGDMGEVIDPAMEKQMRLSYRYIDGEGQPIAVEADEEPLDPSLFGQELKRLPVRMVVRMDTRWLSRLITELANADLQIQVTEVRVGEVSEGMGDAYGAMGGGEGGMGGMGGRGGMGGGGDFIRGFGAGGGDENILAFNRKPFMKPVIIQGIVLIFNKPDQSILRDDGSAEDFDAGVVMR